MIAQLRQTMTHAVTNFDRRASRRRGYNIYALAQYMEAVDRVVEAVKGGAQPRAAVTEAFNDRLRDALLRALDQPVTSREEPTVTNAAGLADPLFV